MARWRCWSWVRGRGASRLPREGVRAGGKYEGRDAEERPRGLLSGGSWMVGSLSGRGSGRGEGEAIRAGRGTCQGGSWGGVCGRVSVSKCFHIWGWRRDGSEGVGDVAQGLRVEGVRRGRCWRQDAAHLVRESSLGREAEALREGRGTDAVLSGRGVVGVVTYHRRGITGFSGHWWRGLQSR